MGTFIVVLVLSGILYLLYKEFLKEGGLAAAICELGFHKFDSWKYINETTCEKRKACSACGKFLPDSESRIEHSWIFTYLHDRSCEKQEICSHCKDRRGDVIIEHTWHESFIGENSNKKRKVCKRCSHQTAPEISQSQWQWIFENGNARSDFLSLQYALRELSLSNDMFLVSNQARGDQVSVVDAYLPGTNVTVRGLRVGNIDFMFYPDGLYALQHQTKSLASITLYSASAFNISIIRVENSHVPNDSEVVGRTWLHSRKDGGPDLRYSYNPSVSIMAYALFSFTTSQVGESQIAVSKNTNAQRFCNSLLTYLRAYVAEQYNHEYKNQGSHSYNSQYDHYNSSNSNNSRNDSGSGSSDRLTLETSYKVLGIRNGASREEIKSAYYELVQKYHPDKVFHLADEFKVIAEEKMKQINAAYAMLKESVR